MKKPSLSGLISLCVGSIVSILLLIAPAQAEREFYFWTVKECKTPSEFMVALYAKNGNQLMHSECYKTKAGAKKALESFRRAAKTEIVVELDGKGDKGQ